jgi:hypothetical protein
MQNENHNQDQDVERNPLEQVLLGNQVQNEEDSEYIWALSRTDDGPFFKLPLLEQLRRRPYHVASVEGPFRTKWLLKRYSDKIFRSQILHKRKAKPMLERLLIVFGNNLFAVLEETTVTVYAPTPEAAELVAAEFRRHIKRESSSKPGFHLIGIAAEGPYTELVAVGTSGRMSAHDLALHYGDDFNAWENNWIDRLSKRRSGVTILFGPPGCGKTSYLKGMMSRFIRKFVFYYLPISEFELLCNPRFNAFWVRQTQLHKIKHKIVILEDAENLLLPRDDASRSSVSNLLNIGDGFLGEHLRLHIIATTNAPLEEFDSALLRPGRLMGTREFRRLSRAEAMGLADAKGLELPDQLDYSLAEIYCSPPASTKLSRARRIGFGQMEDIVQTMVAKQ